MAEADRISLASNFTGRARKLIRWDGLPVRDNGKSEPLSRHLAESMSVAGYLGLPEEIQNVALTHDACELYTSDKTVEKVNQIRAKFCSIIFPDETAKKLYEAVINGWSLNKFFAEAKIVRSAELLDRLKGFHIIEGDKFVDFVGQCKDASDSLGQLRFCQDCLQISDRKPLLAGLRYFEHPVPQFCEKIATTSTLCNQENATVRDIMKNKPLGRSFDYYYRPLSKIKIGGSTDHSTANRETYTRMCRLAGGVLILLRNITPNSGQEFEECWQKLKTLMAENGIKNPEQVLENCETYAHNLMTELGEIKEDFFETSIHGLFGQDTAFTPTTPDVSNDPFEMLIAAVEQPQIELRSLDKIKIRNTEIDIQLEVTLCQIDCIVNANNEQFNPATQPVPITGALLPKGTPATASEDLPQNKPGVHGQYVLDRNTQNLVGVNQENTKN